MTDEEKYLTIGRVVSEHAARKQHLAALEAKAKQIGELMSLVGNILTGSVRAQYEFGADGQILIGPGQVNQSRGGSGRWPSADELRALLKDIETTRQEIIDLDRQRRELGVS